MARNTSVGNTLSAGNPAPLQVFTTNDFTVLAFCHPVSLPGAAVQSVVSKRGANITTITFELAFWNQRLRFAISDGATYNFCESGVLSATPGPIWIAGIAQGPSLRCYVNAIPSAGSAAAAISMAERGAAFRIGADSSGLADFVGRVAVAAVWRSALRDVELAQIFQGAASPLDIRRQELRGYWPIWGIGSAEVDLSGGKSNAVLVGAPTAAIHPNTGLPLISRMHGIAA